MEQVRITFPCGDIQLEGVWHFPEITGPIPAVIVCHPHSLYGGSMSNTVIFLICEALAQRSIAALRFNFRGVGRSGGEYGDGIGEEEDVKAALALVLATANIGSERVGLAGYSFGASVALPVAVKNEEVSLLALISPALSESGWEQLKAYSRPTFLISGEYDHVMTPEQVKERCEGTTAVKQYEIISGADHFWEGYAAEVAGKVAGFFVAGFKRI